LLSSGAEVKRRPVNVTTSLGPVDLFQLRLKARQLGLEVLNDFESRGAIGVRLLEQSGQLVDLIELGGPIGLRLLEQSGQVVDLNEACRAIGLRLLEQPG
jgi:hypothetical protein